uniref:Uncharacterized protein LOC104219430 n=1 Tax=Nicotiana sylvestris TaxID=4096 RepID=A0A1U7W1B5_NICSY|nr:PREDICTED: uncharacterized protein LOC104219430 [Nicotiana sylvestris]
MQLIKAHKFQDSYSVRNTWNTSKLWINPTFPQPEEFKTRLLSVRDSCFERLTQTISQQSFSFSDELQKGIAEVKTISQLVQSMQVRSLFLSSFFDLSEDRFFYLFSSDI